MNIAAISYHVVRKYAEDCGHASSGLRALLLQDDWYVESEINMKALLTVNLFLTVFDGCALSGHSKRRSLFHNIKHFNENSSLFSCAVCWRPTMAPWWRSWMSNDRSICELTYRQKRAAIPQLKNNSNWGSFTFLWFSGQIHQGWRTGHVGERYSQRKLHKNNGQI